MKIATQIEDVFKKSGISSAEIHQGEVWRIPDNLLSFPEDRLPKPKRTKHIFRSVVILSAEEDCQDPTHITLLVAPLSTKTKIKKRTDFLIKKEEGKLKADSVVRLGVIFAILKVELIKRECLLSAKIFEKVQAVLLTNLGIVHRS